MGRRMIAVLIAVMFLFAGVAYTQELKDPVVIETSVVEEWQRMEKGTWDSPERQVFIDAGEDLLKMELRDADRVSVLNTLVSQMANLNPKRSLELAEEINIITDTLGYQKGYALYYTRGAEQEAIEYIQSRIDAELAIDSDYWLLYHLGRRTGNRELITEGANYIVKEERNVSPDWIRSVIPFATNIELTDYTRWVRREDLRKSVVTAIKDNAEMARGIISEISTDVKIVSELLPSANILTLPELEALQLIGKIWAGILPQVSENEEARELRNGIATMAEDAYGVSTLREVRERIAELQR